ncbi:hypothetical protein CRH02_18355 [Escherichia albertii]|nr:hypothetical protein CRH02_18355 [Escherichia albertii]
MAFEVQEGGKTMNPRELTKVSDQGERGQPRHLQLERRRV